MALDDVTQLELHYHCDQKAFITTFHYKEVVEDTGPNNLEGLGAAWAARFETKIPLFLSEDVRLGCVVLNKIVSGPTRALPARLYFLDTSGSLTGRALPGNTICRVNLYGQNQSRSSRGGQLWSGTRLIDEDKNGPLQTLQDLINTNLIDNYTPNLIGGAPSTGEWEFGFMSRANVAPGPPLLAWPGNFVTVTQAAVSQFYSTLRTRQGTYTSVDAVV